jgi:hypothetical protein
LHLTGRDVEEAEHALRFRAASGAWELPKGPVVNFTVGDTRAAILAYVGQHGAARPKELADALGRDYDLVRQTLRRMVEAGQLDTDGNGSYFTPHT